MTTPYLNTINNRTSNVNTKNVMLKITLKAADRFNFAHMNACSLCPDEKMAEFRHIFADTNVHAIAVSETFFKTKDTFARVNMPGYKLYRNDRYRRKGGGVALYIKDCFRSRLIAKSEKKC